jgi:hypothetical protein
MTLKEVKENPPVLDVRLVDIGGTYVGGIQNVQVIKQNNTNGYIMVKGKKVCLNWNLVHHYANSSLSVPVNVDSIYHLD